MPKSQQQPNWEARKREWDTRVESLGVDRAVFHLRHRTPEALAAITKLQEDAILPIFHELLGGVPAYYEERDVTLLDFGCGIGRWSPTLQQIGRAIAVDPTAQFLEYAKEHSPLDPPSEYRLYCDGRIPMDDGEADVVWACMVLSTVLDDAMLAATVAEIDRVLKPGGLMFLVDNTWGQGKPVRSRWSMSRTVIEYQAAFAKVAPLVELGHYVDLGETNTIMAGRKAVV